MVRLRLPERPGLAKSGLAAALLVGCWAWGRGPAGALGWLGATVVLALVVRMKPVGGRTRAGLERLIAGLVFTVVAMSGLWVTYPVVDEPAVRVFARWVGVLLLGAGVLSLSAWPTMADMRGVVPAAIGLFGLGFLDPVAPQTPPLLAAIGLGLLALLVERMQTGRNDGSLRGWLRWIIAGVASLGLAAAVMRVLPWAQPHMEQAWVQALSGAEASTGADFTGRARLGEFEKLGVSHRVALRLWAPEARLLRGEVFDRFDGREWTAGAVTMILVQPSDSVLPEDVTRVFAGLPGRTFVIAGGATATVVVPGTAAHVVLAQSSGGGLFVPAGAGALRLGGDGVTLDDMGVARASGLWPGEVYGYALANNARSSPPVEADLALPSGTDPRLGILAQELRRDSPSPEEYLRRVMAHLDRECVYSLEPGHFRSQQPVAEFLFEKKRGYCEYFASAAAVLLRMGGMPARFVKGFNVRNANTVGDHFVVRDSDAHAWIDVFLPGRGWVETDPTPAAQFAAVHGSDRPGRFGEWLEAVRAALSEFMARVRAQGLGVLGWIARGALNHAFELAALLALVGGGAVLRRRLRGWRRPARITIRHERESAPGIPPGLLVMVTEIERVWHKRGMPRPSSRALLDHVAALKPKRPGDEARREAERLVIQAYYRARYGGVEPAAGEIAELKERLSAGGANEFRP